MEITQFVNQFAEQFEETDASEFNFETNFREIDEWDSLLSLSIIAMVDEEYNVRLTGDDIRNSKTIQDLYAIVNSKV
jgi:acyl carrier protein